MNKLNLIILLLVLQHGFSQDSFTIAFGSCNKQTMQNNLWDDVLESKPNLWIWAGDNIYADTEKMSKMKKDYRLQMRQNGYQEIMNTIPIMGVWDDHDYGVNDGGLEYSQKEKSQELFFDFIGIPKTDPIRKQKGTYHSKTFKTEKGSVKIIGLDTRYHRTALLTAETKKKRYLPNPDKTATILGMQQWNWLEKELKNSTADFNIIVSSIQVISDKHRFEKWSNFPYELEKLKQLIVKNNAKNVIFLSGDRHISEFSKLDHKELTYPLLDFTSSGLTHAYKNFKSEENPYRVGDVIFTESFGLLKFNFETQTVTFQIIGDENQILQEITQKYR